MVLIVFFFHTIEHLYLFHWMCYSILPSPSHRPNFEMSIYIELDYYLLLDY